MKYLLTCLLLLSPLVAAAQSSDAPKSVSDCERIKNDLAYNQCLASFGPKRGERTTRAAADDEEGPAVARSRSRSGSVRRSRGGRQAAAFDVVSGKRGAARPTLRSARSAPARTARGSRKRR